MNYTSESYKVSDWKYYNSSKLKAMNSYYDEMGVFPTIDDFELSGNAYYIVYKYNNTSCIDEYIIYDEDGNKIGDFGAVAPLSEYGITFKNTNEPVMDSDYFKIKWTDSDTYVQIEFH